MLNLIGIFIKYSILTIAILVLGNILEFRGKTISEHIKVVMGNTSRIDLGQKTHEWRQEMPERISEKLTHKFADRITGKLPNQLNDSEELESVIKQVTQNP